LSDERTDIPIDPTIQLREIKEWEDREIEKSNEENGWAEAQTLALMNGESL
jgi:hypothetical protein